MCRRGRGRGEEAKRILFMLANIVRSTDRIGK